MLVRGTLKPIRFTEIEVFELLSIYLNALEGKNDEESFIEVYNTYKRLVYYTAQKIVDDPYLAEDVLQEVFLYVAKNFPRIVK